MTVKELRSLLYRAPDDAPVTLAGADYDVMSETDSIGQVVKIDILGSEEISETKVVIIAEA